MIVERLENIAEVIAGQSPPSDTYNQIRNGLPFFQGNADFGDMFPKARYWCTAPKKIALPNDILMTVRAPVGPVNICNIESSIGRGLSAIRVKNNHFYKYIYYFLKSYERQIAKLGVGSTFKAITQKDIKNLQIPLPEKFEDQIRIAEILSKTEALIKQRKESIDLLDEFLKSTFVDMFGDPMRNEKGWKVLTLNDVSIQITDGEHTTPIRTQNGIKLLSARNIKNGFIDLKAGLDYISEEEYKRISKRCKPEKNDILMSCSGTVGRVSIINKNEPLSLVRSVALLKLKKDKIIPLFLQSWMQTKYFQNQIKKGAKTSSQSNIFTGAIRKLPVQMPSISLQTQFAQIVKKTEAIKAQFQESLHELENLFGSISQRAFKGELDLNKMEIDSAVFNEINIEEKIVLPEQNLAMQKFIKKTHDFQKLLENQANIAQHATRFLKPIQQMEKLLAPIKNLPVIPDAVIKAQKNYEKMLLTLPKNMQQKEEIKIDWEDVSTQYAADLIKNKYTDFHFTTEMLIRFFKEEHLIYPNYFSSEELKTNPQLHSADDLKSIVFSALNNENPFLKLEQVFYNGEKENFALNITPEDYELIKERSKEERSGVYFTIIS